MMGPSFSPFKMKNPSSRGFRFFEIEGGGFRIESYVGMLGDPIADICCQERGRGSKIRKSCLYDMSTSPKKIKQYQANKEIKALGHGDAFV